MTIVIALLDYQLLPRAFWLWLYFSTAKAWINILEGGHFMSNSLTDYADAFSVSQEDRALSARECQCERRLKKLYKRIKKYIERAAEAERIVEERRIAEEKRIADEKKEKESSFFSKLKEAIVKAIPVILTAVATFFCKKLFGEKKQ
jgi:hypothetical protein